MSNTPLVSVVMPYLRAEETIERALASVLAQSLHDLEVIAVSDGSTDRSRSVVDRLAANDSRVRSLVLDRNRGPSFARNRALDVARGTWIAVLDADDWYDPDRLRRMIDAVGEGPIVVDNLMAIDPDDASEIGIVFPWFPSILAVERIVDQAVPQSAYDFGYVKPVFRRDFVESNGLRYDETLRTAEDLLFLLECGLIAGPIPTVDRGGYFYNLQFSPRSRKLSRTTHSLPMDTVVADRLDALLRQRADRVTPLQRGAIEARRDRLRRDADVQTFRHALQTKALPKAVRLFAASTQVRSYFLTTLRRKLTQMASR